MALSESTELDRCDVLSDGTIIARNVLVIKKDGTVISREKADAVIYNKNADVSSAPDRVKKIAAKIW
jgi:ribosomal protein S8E